MLRLRDLDDYEFTERTRAKIAASFAVFVKEDVSQEENTTDDNHLKVIEPGTINYLTPGQEIQVANPPTSQGFGDFARANLRGIAAGFGTTYESLSGDYSLVNFSSGRMGWLESSRYFEHLQWNLMVPRFCNKVFKWFIESVQLMGALPVNVTPSVTWTPPRREMIDPLKEIQAIKAQLRLGIISWQEVVRQFGQIPEELMEELKNDKEMFEKLGIMTDGDPRFDSNRPPDEVEESDPSIKKDE